MGRLDVAAEDWPAPSSLLDEVLMRSRRVYSERRATGEVVHVEVGHGVVLAVAGWMLDAAICAAMTLPRVSVEALGELHRLLTEHGYPPRESALRRFNEAFDRELGVGSGDARRRTAAIRMASGPTCDACDGCPAETGR